MISRETGLCQRLIRAMQFAITYEAQIFNRRYYETVDNSSIVD